MQLVINRIAQSFVMVGLVLMIIGMLVMPTGTGTLDRSESAYDTTASAEQVDQTNDSGVDSSVSGESQATCCDPTEVVREDHQFANTTPTPLPQQYEQIYWQDSFDDPTSGWEPYFKMSGELPVYAYVNTNKPQSVDLLRSDINYVLSSATAWNGYDGGDYSFTLPGAPMRADTHNDSANYGKYDSLITPYLWDFNISKPLPQYPYLVDVSVSTTLSAGAMVLLDFTGDINNVSAGNGIMVMMPLRQNDGIRYFGLLNSDLNVWEFNNNRLWRLGCTQFQQDTHNDIFSTLVLAQFLVDQNTLSMHIKGDNTPDIKLQCTRAFGGDSTATRFLGIGSRFWSLQVPVPYANVMRFHEIIVAQPDASMLRDDTYVVDNSVSEVRAINCSLFDTETSEDVSLDAGLRGTCFDTEVWVTEPNKFAERIQWPIQTNIFGRWQCNVQAPFANFEIRAEQDYGIILMDGLEYRVVATTYADYPFMMVHLPYGYATDKSNARKWNSEAQIGDYIYSPSLIWYGMRLNTDGTLQTSWMNKPCNRY